MPTNIKSFRNASARSVIAFDAENVGKSFWVKANSSNDTGLWISWHKEQPLVLCTSKGVCYIWDTDWKIHGLWEGYPNEIIFLDGGSAGVGGDIQVTIISDGDVRMDKAP